MTSQLSISLFLWHYACFPPKPRHPPQNLVYFTWFCGTMPEFLVGMACTLSLEPCLWAYPEDSSPVFGECLQWVNRPVCYCSSRAFWWLTSPWRTLWATGLKVQLRCWHSVQRTQRGHGASRVWHNRREVPGEDGRGTSTGVLLPPALCPQPGNRGQ